MEIQRETEYYLQITSWTKIEPSMSLIWESIGRTVEPNHWHSSESASMSFILDLIIFKDTSALSFKSFSSWFQVEGVEYPRKAFSQLQSERFGRRA